MASSGGCSPIRCAVEIEPNGATVLIEPDGTMQAYSAAPGDATQFASLAGVSLPLGS